MDPRARRYPNADILVVALKKIQRDPGPASGLIQSTVERRIVSLEVEATANIRGLHFHRIDRSLIVRSFFLNQYHIFCKIFIGFRIVRGFSTTTTKKDGDNTLI